MTQIREATVEDVKTVLGHPAAFTRAEMRNLFLSPKDVVGHANALIGKGYSLAAEADGRLAFVFYCTPAAHGACRTTFLASSLFDTNPVKALRVLHRAMAKVGEDMAGTTLVAETGSEHPATEKWFEALGFKATRRGNVVKVFEKPL